MNPIIIIGKSEIRDLQKDLGSQTWPEFMQHDSSVVNNWQYLYKYFLNCQFALFDNKKIVGIGNTVHLNWQNSFKDLPEGGLDWAMEKAKDDFDNSLKSNILIGVQILINPQYQSKGISYEMLDIMKKIAKSHRLINIALPVRPTLKYQYPLIPMSDYIKWKNKKGLPFDPWIRVHIKAGGEITGICEKSMDITGAISDWEEWTDLRFPGSGDYIVDKALVPIKIDKENNIGRYVEPNVWIVHKVD